ncbi:32451_t:CDS:2, partial [Gigaspora margarita]
MSHHVTFGFIIILVLQYCNTTIIREGIVFKEIEVDEGESALEENENERTILEENEVIVLEDSEEKNEEISEVPANEAPT